MEQVVVKFGGTSVSTRQNWQNILFIIKKHLANGFQPIIVCSALTQISNLLEKAMTSALVNEHHTHEKEVSHRYTQLALALGVPFSLLADHLNQLQQWLTGIALLQEASAKTQAQILSLGELMLTRLGHAFLQNQGINCHWFDVREALVSTPTPATSEQTNYLAARCNYDFSPALKEKLSHFGEVIITQGFFAVNLQGETVLLGRGGSDTSAALLAAKLQARACEIWTDVPGIYTANPHVLPQARLLKQLHYDEAQEIASMGAKVLHPHAVPPVRQANIPMSVKSVHFPNHSGTSISNERDAEAPLIKSIQVKDNITLISIDTVNMWQEVGFLADVFATFKQHGFSVDLLSSSESNVTVSLDSNAKHQNRTALNELLTQLNRFGRAKIIELCSAISLVGHPIRTILPHLGSALEVFNKVQIYLMSLASNDLNLTFVVDTSQADEICKQLHVLLVENNHQNFYYSKSFEEEFRTDLVKNTSWWETDRSRLLDIAVNNSPCYVYHRAIPALKAEQLKSLRSIDQLFYAIKANPHPALLQVLYEKGISFECVSLGELNHVLRLFPHIEKNRLLFTPNFAKRQEYENAIALGCYITIDNLYPLEKWPELFSQCSILLRIDPDQQAGHHRHVQTAGSASKFGIPFADLRQVRALVKQHNVRIIGLHAHVGSGILTPNLWHDTAKILTDLLPDFPEAKIINLGGGLGIPEKPGQQALDLKTLDDALLKIKSQVPHVLFWLEPGRFFVAESGVLLAKVTQCKQKASAHFIGIETGMNSLMRPTLYDAYHEIVNLSRFEEEKKEITHIVGPICESGDTLGYNRNLPLTYENDIILIANVGAYGHCMSSHYNLRPPAEEIIIG